MGFETVLSCTVAREMLDNQADIASLCAVCAVLIAFYEGRSDACHIVWILGIGCIVT